MAEPAVTNINHKLWEIIQKQKKRTAVRKACVNEPVSKPQSAPQVTPQVTPIPKVTKKTVDETKANPTTEPATNSAVPELIPLENAIQSFLTSSKLDGYIDPFLELDIIKNCQNPEKIAGMINQALCIIRYLCKGDRIFCVGALYNMLESVSPEAENFTLSTALSVGASAANSEAFDMYFEKNPEERWHHIYIIDVDWKIELEDFIDWVKSAFETQHYPYTDFLHHPEFLRLIHLQEEDAVHVWVDAMNEILKPQDLSLKYIESNGDNYLLVLLNRIEANVFKGMMDTIQHSVTP